MKRIISALILVFFIVVFSIPAFAAASTYYGDYATKLAEIGVFKGTGTGFELEREPNRLEGLIMLIRLLGKESEAKSLATAACSFTDVPVWGRGYVNYAYKNGLTNGVGNNKFGTQDKMNGKSYVTFLLRSLGYSDSEAVKDFTWAGSIEYAKSIGLLDEDLYYKIISNTFIRDFVAKSSYNALLQPLKGDTTTLIQKLVSNGVLTQSQADSLKSLNGSGSTSDSDPVLTSIEIGKLADAVVMIKAERYDGTTMIGSGFYTTQDGNLVTNFHVVEGAKTITITENDGTVYSGSIKVIGYDIEKDIAVLDIDKTVKLFLKIGNSDKVVLGEEIYTIGSPYGLKNTISNGIVSSIREDGIIQITAPISHGSSGGVLLNNKGYVIGITFAGIDFGQNLGFAIPINKYVNMPKNLQLDLATFYNQLPALQKPTNVALKQISGDTITVSWDKVSTADYYKVYLAESANGPYYPVTDDNGNDDWYWDSDYCMQISYLDPGATYYVKVTAVKGTKESDYSDVKFITITGTSYKTYSQNLLNTYGNFTVNGYTTKFSDVTVENTSRDNTLGVYFFLDKAYLSAFNDMMNSNKAAIEEKLTQIAAEVAKAYGKDVAVTILYTDYFDTNPVEFAVNNINPQSVTYLSSSNKWQVVYPYVCVAYEFATGQKYTVWAK